MIVIIVLFTDESNGEALLGILDYSFLFAYAIAMYFR